MEDSTAPQISRRSTPLSTAIRKRAEQRPQPPGRYLQISAIGSPVVVCTSPSDVGINPATGAAIVANSGSGDITVFNIATPTSIKTFCSDTRAATSGCPVSGPNSVAVDYVRNIALVANSTSKSIAVVDLATLSVT